MPLVLIVLAVFMVLIGLIGLPGWLRKRRIGMTTAVATEAFGTP